MEIFMTTNNTFVEKVNRFENREIPSVVKRMPENLQILLEKIKSYICSLGDEVSCYEARRYYSYRLRGKQFAVVIPDKTRVIINLLVDPATVEIDNYFTRDLENIHSYGSTKLRLQLFVRNDVQLEKAQSYILRAYKACK